MTKAEKRRETKMIRCIERSLTRLVKVVKRLEMNVIRYLEMTLKILPKVEKRVETMMIQCLEMAPEQIREKEEKEEKLRCFKIVAVYYSRENWKKKDFTKDQHLALYVYLNRLRLFPSLIHFFHLGFIIKENKRNRLYFRLSVYRAIGLMSKVFTNYPGDWGSIKSYQRVKKWYLMLIA